MESMLANEGGGESAIALRLLSSFMLVSNICEARSTASKGRYEMTYLTLIGFEMDLPQFQTGLVELF